MRLNAQHAQLATTQTRKALLVALLVLQGSIRLRKVLPSAPAAKQESSQRWDKRHATTAMLELTATRMQAAALIVQQARSLARQQLLALIAMQENIKTIQEKKSAKHVLRVLTLTMELLLAQTAQQESTPLEKDSQNVQTVQLGPFKMVQARKIAKSVQQGSNLRVE